jgi:hypothetical protein
VRPLLRINSNTLTSASAPGSERTPLYEPLHFSNPIDFFFAADAGMRKHRPGRLQKRWRRLD